MGPSTAVTRKLCAQVLEDTMKGRSMSWDGTVNICTQKNRINICSECCERLRGVIMLGGERQWTGAPLRGCGITLIRLMLNKLVRGSGCGPVVLWLKWALCAITRLVNELLKYHCCNMLANACFVKGLHALFLLFSLLRLQVTVFW